MKKIITLTLLVAICIMSMSLVCCDMLGGDNPDYDVTVDPDMTTATEKENATEKVEATGLWADAIYRSDKSFGEGDKTIQVNVRADGKSVTFTIKTNAATLADALIENNLVEGDMDMYGLYIKRVNGILADYNIDGTYWSLEVNGEVANYGASGAEIVGGEKYTLIRQKY